MVSQQIGPANSLGIDFKQSSIHWTYKDGGEGGIRTLGTVSRTTP